MMIRHACMSMVLLAWMHLNSEGQELDLKDMNVAVILQQLEGDWDLTSAILCGQDFDASRISCGRLAIKSDELTFIQTMEDSLVDWMESAKRPLKFIEMDVDTKQIIATKRTDGKVTFRLLKLEDAKLIVVLKIDSTKRPESPEPAQDNLYLVYEKRRK